MKKETVVYRYGGNVAWGDYLLENSVNNLAKTVEKQTTTLFDIRNQQASSIIGSNQIISDTINTGFDQLGHDLGAIDNSITNMHSSIMNMHSDFNYFMTLTVGALEAINESFMEIIGQLDAIHDTLKHPLLTKAAELRKIGFQRLRQKLLDKAIESFLESNELFDTDFIVNLEIGKLYLYGKDEYVDLLNLDKAKKFLINAARYAQAVSNEIALRFAHKKSNRYNLVLEKASEALFHTSIACYVDSNSYLTKNPKYSLTLIKEALGYVNKAISLNNEFDQAHFHKAKYSALLKDKIQLKEGIESALLLDRKYIFKLYSDEDILGLKNEVDKIVLNLMINYKTECLEKIKSINKTYNSFLEMKIEGDILNVIKDKINSTENLLNTGKYLDVRKANEEITEEWIQHIKDELQKEKEELKKREELLYSQAQDLREECNKLLKSLEDKKLQRYIDANELAIHQKKVLGLRSLGDNAESLLNSISFLKNEKKWLQNELDEARKKLKEKKDKYKSVANGVRILGMIAGTVLPIIAGYMFLANFQYYEKSFSFLLLLYTPSIITLSSVIIISIGFALGGKKILPATLYCIGICALGPLIYFLVVVILTIILLIPGLIMVIVGANELLDTIFQDWIVDGGFILMSILQWFICMRFLWASDN